MRFGEKGVHPLWPKRDMSRWSKTDEDRRRGGDVERDLIIQSMLKHFLVESGGKLNRLRKQ